MLFSFLLFVAFAATVYYHYVQGAMTATISALCAACATAVAFSYYEPLALNIAPGKFVDSIPSVMLVALFSLTYIILRILMDTLVPGNIRLPLWLDRGSAVLFGIVAALFATGTWSVAGQLLPFGATMGMYSRFDMQDRPIHGAPSARGFVDAALYDEIKDAQDLKFPVDRANAGLFPVDSFVLGFVNFVSTGSLAGERSLKSQSPDLMTDAFVHRLTFGGAAKHTAMAGGKSSEIDLVDVFQTTSPLKAIDGELPVIRTGNQTPSGTELKDVPAGQIVLRVNFHDSAADEGTVHLALAMCRIYRSPDPTKSEDSQNNYPLGTLQGPSCMVFNRTDDPLFIKPGQPVDIVFTARAGDLVKKPDGTVAFAPGTFAEIKRFGRFSLEGKTVNPGPTDAALGVLRKELRIDAIAERGGVRPKEASGQ